MNVVNRKRYVRFVFTLGKVIRRIFSVPYHAHTVIKLGGEDIASRLGRRKNKFLFSLFDYDSLAMQNKNKFKLAALNQC